MRGKSVEDVCSEIRRIEDDLISSGAASASVEMVDAELQWNPVYAGTGALVYHAYEKDAEDRPLCAIARGGCARDYDLLELCVTRLPVLVRRAAEERPWILATLREVFVPKGPGDMVKARAREEAGPRE